MAKKRKIIAEKKEPEYEFVPPDFDEREFILKDMFGTKITIVISIIAVIMGIICSFIFKSGGDVAQWASIVVMFVGMFLLRFILKLVRLDPDMLSAGSQSTGNASKSMLGNYFVYLFLCLAVWILLINPPFY